MSAPAIQHAKAKDVLRAVEVESESLDNFFLAEIDPVESVIQY